MLTDLKGKTVLITGASGGIGIALAEAFAAEGAHLVLHYHRRRKPVADFLRRHPERLAMEVQADLRKEADVKRLFSQAYSVMGQVDTLVANAGIWVAQDVALHRMSLRQWQATIETDLTASFLCARQYLRLVAKQRRGNIIFIGSTAGVFGEPGHADYACAKSALAFGLTRTLKNEIARIAPHTSEYCGGRVNCVSPGWTVTPLTEGCLQDEALVKKVTATMALPQIARATDVANAVVYLASDTLARHVTGQNLVLAGGMEGRWLWRPEEVDATIA
jgi:3-oxoacyl-[acyl-carrier protein] reductase